MTTSTPPLISVIVCTYNRRERLRGALDSVISQGRDDIEVIVVDDGSDQPVILSESVGGNVHLIRTPHRGVGAARAEGLDAARGKFVAYCDDDDRWTADHLGVLLDYLLANPSVDLVYGDSRWIDSGSSRPRVSFSVDYDASRLAEFNYIFASDVMHRADAAKAVGGFDLQLEAYEDWDLWLRMSRHHTMRHLPRVIGTHHWHTACVSADAGSDSHWLTYQKVYQDHQQRLTEVGDAFRHDLLVDETSGAAAFDPATWRAGRRELICHALVRPNQGYGSVARQLILALERQGIDLTMAPTRNQPAPGLERLYKPLDHWGRFALYYNYLNRPTVIPSRRVISYAMSESTLVPRETIDQINRCVTLQYVPCRQNLHIFEECGVRVPMKVLHHGVDVGRFPLLERNPHEVFTFGTFGELSPRKGIDVLIRAFQDEFKAPEPVRLLMKSVSPAAAYQTDDPRIQVVSGFMDPSRLLELLREMDVFVMPSRGEGFGLCGLEAMSTGLPLIATNWSGPADYLDPADSFLLNYRLVDAQGTRAHHMRFFGLWAEPDYEHLRQLMRWAYEHPTEAAIKGRAAAHRVHQNWTWDRVAQQFQQDLDEINT
jgi:glycosyltransferase involved in cell wall biosynthesis